MLIIEWRIEELDQPLLETFDSRSVFNHAAPIFQRPKSQVSGEPLRSPSGFTLRPQIFRITREMFPVIFESIP
jgi:hypothetical protein